MTKKTTKKESKPKIPEIIVVGLKIVKAENFASENKMGKKGWLIISFVVVNYCMERMREQKHN